MSSVVDYSRENNHPLCVTIKTAEETKEFKVSASRYRQLIRNYCTWYSTVTVSKTYNDYEETIKLANGIEFNAILY